MKKRCIGALTFMALIAINVYNANSFSHEDNLTIDGIELCAEGEDYELNPWYKWLTDGITKDERELAYYKYVYNGHTSKTYRNDHDGSYRDESGRIIINSDGQWVYSDSYDYQLSSPGIKCAAGYENCSRVGVRF